MKKVALITGSSRGIGRAEAITLARDGYAVCVNCVEREDKAQELVDMLRSNGCETMWYKADVSDSTAVKQMVAAIEEKLDIAYSDKSVPAHERAHRIKALNSEKLQLKNTFISEKAKIK